MSNIELRKTFRFEAAHYLPKVGPLHKCRNLHGHSYKLTVILRGPCDPVSGWLIDFAQVKEFVFPLLKTLDHSCLNEIDGLENPTSENIAIFSYRYLASTLPHLHQVIISETESSECRYPV